MRRRNADVLGVLLSFTLLAMCLLAVLLGGVRIYRGLAERGQESFQRRTAMEFLETRLRQVDGAGGVWLGAFDGTESREGDTLYTTFEVYAGPMAKLTPAELWAGRQTRGEGSPLRLAYLDRLLRQTERAIAGLKRSKRPEDASRLAELEQVHQGLLDMKEEWLSWQR